MHQKGHILWADDEFGMLKAHILYLEDKGYEVTPVNSGEDAIQLCDEFFFDVRRNIPNDNCYFCHSTMVVDKERSEFWQHGEDIHLKRGMNCVDCHRNGLDHQMVRGYPNEYIDINSPEYP